MVWIPQFPPGFRLTTGSQLNSLVDGINSFTTQWGTNWFVDGNQGLDTYGGQSPQAPFRTMAKAFTEVGSGDRIYFRGNIREQLTTPAGIFDVSIIGMGNRPRHADAHTDNNGYSAATWKLPASPSQTTPLLIIQQQGWVLQNILFDGPDTAASVQIFRDAGAGDAERDGSHVFINGCKFVAAQNHIELKGGLSQCMLVGNDFFGSTGFSLIETVGAGVGTNNYHILIGNRWNNNASHVDCGMNQATITGNTFGQFATTAIDLRTGSNNQVWGNSLMGTYSNVGGYWASGATDSWAGNFNVLSGGVTAANPA